MYAMPHLYKTRKYVCYCYFKHKWFGRMCAILLKLVASEDRKPDGINGGRLTYILLHIPLYHVNVLSYSKISKTFLFKTKYRVFPKYRVSLGKRYSRIQRRNNAFYLKSITLLLVTLQGHS